MSIPRDHHYVPEFLQKRFVNSNNKLFFFDKTNPYGITEKSPSQVFKKRDLNTIKNLDGSLNVELEDVYSRIENDIAPIIVRIDEQAKSGRLPKLNFEEKSCWDRFYYHQHSRAPDVFERLGGVEEIQRNYERQVSEDFENGIISQTYKEYLLSKKGAYTFIQETSVCTRGLENEDILNQFSKFGMLIGVIEPKNKSFIMGDYPIVALEPKNSIAQNNRAEIWFPISSSVAISYCENRMECLINLKDHQVRKINSDLYDQSNFVAAGSRALIKSFARYDLKKR